MVPLGIPRGTPNRPGRKLQPSHRGAGRTPGHRNDRWGAADLSANHQLPPLGRAPLLGQAHLLATKTGRQAKAYTELAGFAYDPCADYVSQIAVCKFFPNNELVVFSNLRVEKV